MQSQVTSIRVPVDLKVQIQEIAGQKVSSFLIAAAREKLALIQSVKNQSIEK
jgi:hypothetical protein